MKLKKVNQQPLRYLLFKDEQECFTIGRKAYLFFFKQKKGLDFSDENILLKKIAKKEYHFLLEELYSYLAIKEISPKKLNNWFEKRLVHVQLKKKIIQKIKNSQFYSEERFVEMFIKTRYEQAKRPWWLVEKELLAEGLVEELVKKYAFQDFTMLKENFLNKKIVGFEKLKSSLTRQGFSFETINKLLDFLKNTN